MAVWATSNRESGLKAEVLFDIKWNEDLVWTSSDVQSKFTVSCSMCMVESVRSIYLFWQDGRRQNAY